MFASPASLGRLGLLAIVVALSIMFMGSNDMKFPLGVLTGIFVATGDWQEFRGRWCGIAISLRSKFKR